MAFGVYDGINFGAPQNRVRLVLSTPKIIKRINEAPASGRVSMDEAFMRARVPLPKGASHVKNSAPLKEGTALRPLTGPSFTCYASRALSFCTPSGKTVLSMRPPHTRTLMGLPNSFKLSGIQRIDQRVFGNGLCYGLARAMCLAAQGREITPLYQTPSRKRTRGEDSDGDIETHCMCKELETRVVRLEHRLLKLQKQLRRSQSYLCTHGRSNAFQHCLWYALPHQSACVDPLARQLPMATIGPLHRLQTRRLATFDLGLSLRAAGVVVEWTVCCVCLVAFN